jgi:hypothetical protein
MFRPTLSASWLAVSLIAATLVACLAPAEQPVLNQFFAASRLRDHTALSAFATVAFEPNTHGIVNTFAITNVTPEQRQPLGRETVRKTSEPVIALSVADPRNPVDVTKYDGDLVSKDVTIDAPVKLPSGQTPQKTLVVTMQRAELRGDRSIIGRWIITKVIIVDIKDASGSAATPRS